MIMPTLDDTQNRSIEGFGIAYIEAAFFSIPSIASNVGGNKELVIDNKNGFLINPQDVDELNKKIIQLSEDNKLVEIFGKKSSELIKNFQWSSIGKKYLKLYESLLKQ